MNTTENKKSLLTKQIEFKNIREKLSYIQSNLVVGKTENNAFGKYKYRTIDTILSSAKDLLKEAKTAISLSDEIVVICDKPYIKATATLIDSDTDELISSTAYARESLDKKGMDVSQMTGSSSTYARKYALCGLLAVEGETDIDAMDNNENNENHESEVVTDEKFKDLINSIPSWKKPKTINDLIAIYESRKMKFTDAQIQELRNEGLQ